MDSLLAAWRVSLHRTRADWPIVVAAGLIATLAATLLAAGPIYSNAVSIAGLQRQLESAPVADANVEIVARVNPADAAAADTTVAAALDDAFRAAGVEVVAMAASDTFALPTQSDGEVRDLAVLGFLQGAQDNVTLVAGAWPTPAVADAPVQVAVLESIAQSLDLDVGERLVLTSRLDEARSLEIVVASTYRLRDPAAPFWWHDPALTDGVVESNQYRTFGPFLATSEDVLARGLRGVARLTWHAFPRIDDLTVESMSGLRAGLGGLRPRLAEDLPGTLVSVTTGLPTILAEADRSLLVSRTGVLVLMLQLAVLAGYAIVLTAGLIVDHRRVDTAVLRSRGANPPQVALLALVEAVIVAVPASLVAPWLAAGALRLFNIAGPLSGIGLRIDPVVTADAYLAAEAAGLGCAVLLMLPAFVAARSFADEGAATSRQETRTLGQRLGLDIALVVVTVIGLWQLRLYGAPLTRTVQGTLGIDPLLVAAPAIGMLAGSVLALRVVPLLALAAEGVVSRGRRLVGSLGVRQLARRPLRYTRASLLLMLAVSMGVFAVSYIDTWSQSQRDQADFRVGADLRVSPSRGAGAIPAWGLDHAYRSMEGVAATTPVDREGFRLTPATPSGELLGVDAGSLAAIVAMRDDSNGERLGGLLRPLVEQRPQTSAPLLPVRPQRLLVSASVEIDAARLGAGDPEPGEADGAETPSVLARSTVVASATIRDARGLLYQFSSAPARLTSEKLELVIPIVASSTNAPSAAAADASFAGPIQLLDVDIEVRLPAGAAATGGRVGLDGVAVSQTGTDADWQPFALDGGRWQLAWSQDPGTQVVRIPDGLVEGRSMVFGDRAADRISPFDVMPGINRNGNGVTTSFTAAGVMSLAGGEVQAVANRAFLEASAARVGDRVRIPLGGASRPVRIVGAVEAVPTTDPAKPAVIVDLPTVELLDFAATRTIGVPGEWWLDVDEAVLATVADGDTGPLAGAGVQNRVELRDRLSADPIALAMIGALSLGFVVAIVFAVVGLAVTAAVSVRQRRTEFALLRALGLSTQELSHSLWLENGSLVAVSLTFGTTLGLVVAWVVLPFVTVTQEAAVPFPPVTVEVPWSTIVVLELVTIGALVVTLVALSRLARRSGLGSVLRMGDD